MKSALALILGLTTAFAGVAATQNPHTKLQTTPVTVYANFDTGAATFVREFNRLARPGDALVVSFVDAFKQSFRAQNLGVTAGEVWVYTNKEASLTQALRRNMEGVRGVIFIPDRYDDRTRLTVNSLREDTRALQIPLTVGLAYADTRTLDHVTDVARGADTVTIYSNEVLRQGRSAYRNYVERVVKAAREANPAIKVEVAIAVGNSPESTEPLLAVVRDNSDLADRIAIYCDERPESIASLTALVHGMRE